MNTRRAFLHQALAAGTALTAVERGASAASQAATPPPAKAHLQIGAILYPQLDQIDFTGPFEVLSRLPDAAFHILGKEKAPVRDVKGLLLTPEETFRQAPQLDVLLVPGGWGQQALMDDEATLGFLREQAARARYVFSVCTGALLCGAAGLLQGKRATTHWSAMELLPYFGATAVEQRVVVDGRLVSAAGVTAGIDGALRLAALLRGDQVAQEIQLNIQYAPEPPFRSGTPATAPPEVLRAQTEAFRRITEERRRTAQRYAERQGR
jgi:cyclohexyl-isocyanide hydratase